MSNNPEQLNYPVEQTSGEVPHGNTRRGLPFHGLAVGDGFRVPPEDYGRTNSARAHYQKKMEKAGNTVKFSSRGIKNQRGEIVEYVFRRVK